MHQERSERRFLLPVERRIKIGVQRYSDLNCRPNVQTQAATIVDINQIGIKLLTPFSFAQQEPCILRLPLPTGGIVRVASEIRWSQAYQEKSDTWISGCLVSSDFPTKYINQIASLGFIERRRNNRFQVYEPVAAVWDHSEESNRGTIVEVSLTGVGLFSEKPGNTGDEIQLTFADESISQPKLVVQIVHESKVTGGYLFGCKIMKGSVEPLVNQCH